MAAVLGLAPVAWGGGTVTNATPAALQAALNGGGTVTFAVAGVITLTNTIIIAQDTVLDAAGFDVTISGGNAVRLFQVDSNVAFSASGLTLANGNYVGANGESASPGSPGQDGSGAGVLNLGGTVALTGCALTNHYAQGGTGGMGVPEEGFSPGGSAYGAAICNQGGTVNLTNCILAGNSTLGGAPWVGMLSGAQRIPGQALGAAISCADGQLNLRGVTCSANSVAGAPGMGGAIYATNSTVVIANSELSGNSANGSLAEGLGGALFLTSDATALVELCSFTNNAANGGRLEPHSGVAAFGGAVYGAGSLQIMASTFSGNACYGGFGTPPGVGQGGAVVSTKNLLLNGCTFDRNTAQAGNATSEAGGMSQPGVASEGGAVWSSGVLAATNTTWATNSAKGGDAYNDFSNLPGGAGSGGALCVSGGSATLVNVTVAGNQAVGGGQEQGSQVPTGPSQGGGLFRANASVLVLNSILANNPSGGDVWGVVTDGGRNICSDGTAGFSATGSLNSTNPLLGPLAENGGPTLTMSLLPGSPALDAIPSGFPPVDQRGVSRPQGPRADIGAFESLAGTAGGALVITILPGNSVAIQFLGVPGTTYTVEASTDLTHWTAIGVASAGTNSGFEFIDPAANLTAARFYRTRVP